MRHAEAEPAFIAAPSRNEHHRATQAAAAAARRAEARELFELLREREPGPCDACRHVARCAQGEACEAFAVFVHRPTSWQGAPRQRRHDIYVRLFEEQLLKVA
ncbi:MAG: hypothetical protein JSR73_10060 [Proteobacteria bacterium]|nr:hypothetical protein [Pseudomonadota bacterium]